MKRRILLRAIILAGATVVGSHARSDDTSFEELLKKVPAWPNVIVMLNPEKIFASEVATEGGWKQKYGETNVDTPLLMPPTAQQFVWAC